ncbi:antibiotic biosynthesis monooxygenase [Shewanella sp. 1_MG-2023]|uniref:antibiotic biosynthesis monooxygenase family protein n=1 Tax=unclassified Shewanella TaxID=196818 RepID=UPI0026E23258|nr:MULTISPECIES: antibiotic biosynthesis monooxygenase [unclassified Shewanella]MDO6612188.1 antibiotic biosynthesis monooxygenase [Shewanella sp. 7_MG-2023]MDO6772042.1 antibiotic biosynthesis monooxygenase [Shewanella sp. 2_MG-2023]MDO6795782.1 antibiotic biosynthesis monooxygenase [Shewanella sp. 1_MG-2023]
MFAVIFKAKVGEQNQHYLDTVAIMRDLAFEQYGCIDFIAVSEGEQEIAISYWQSEDDIKRWHQDSKHSVAQKLGQDKWYASYTVEIVEVKRKYSFGE